jgi:hypothetical protein
MTQQVETRDAVVYSIDTQTRKALVKIQGSSVLIVAHFPSNMEQMPSWLKVNNTVRITHTEANRGRVELTGPGFLKPTPVAGDPGSPSLPIPSPVRISGLNILATNPPSMDVTVTAGSFRLNNIIYTLAADDTVTIPSISTSFRYDNLNIGANLTIDVQSGTDAETPVMPTVPAEHLKLGHVLTRVGMTVINQIDINRLATTRVPSYIVMTITDAELGWAEASTSVTVTVYDQYGDAINPETTWEVTLSIANGNGTVENSDEETSTTEITGESATSAVVFTYTRDQTVNDLSPYLIAELVGRSFTTGNVIIVLDESGNPM